MKIYSPNKEYIGVSASVSFCNGKGETDDPHLIQWFKDHGYKVEGDGPTEEIYAAGDLVEPAKAAKKKASV